MVEYIAYGEGFKFTANNQLELEMFYKDDYFFYKITKIEKYIDGIKVSEVKKE